MDRYNYRCKDIYKYRSNDIYKFKDVWIDIWISTPRPFSIFLDRPSYESK